MSLSKFLTCRPEDKRIKTGRNRFRIAILVTISVFVLTASRVALHRLEQQQIDREFVYAVDAADYQLIHKLLARGANANMIIYPDAIGAVLPTTQPSLLQRFKELWRTLIHPKTKQTLNAYAYTPIVRLYEKTQLEVDNGAQTASAALEDAALDIIHHSTPEGMPKSDKITDYKVDQLGYPLAFHHHRAARELMLRFPRMIKSHRLLEIADESDTEWMLQHGANAANGDAMASASLEKARVLFRYGANANLKDNMNEPALSMHCQLGETSIIKLLLQHGSDPNAPGNEGVTPLHWAAAYCDAGAFKALVKAGGNLHMRSKKGDTCLMYASASEHEDTFQCVLGLSNRKDIHAIGVENNNALTIAEQSLRYAGAGNRNKIEDERRRFREFVDSLKRAGAQHIKPSSDWWSSALGGT